MVQIATGLESGAAVLKGTGLIVEENIEENDILKIFVPDNATYNFEELPERDNRHYLARRRRRRELVEIGLETRNHRKLAATKGVLETLVVRVNAPNTPAGGEVADVSQLRDDIFIDSVSLRTQYAACSKNQLIIEPAPEHIATSGIVTVDISTSPSSGSSALQTDALNTATANFGNLPDQYDLVMFCQPGGSGGWVAYAYINSWLSFYNSYWCQRVSAQVHEVGHNLGLGHSNEGSQNYADTTGMMGFSYDSDDGPRKCFNAVKNYQLGWYDLQKEAYDPLSNIGGTKTYVMNGVDEYQSTESEGKFITIRLINKPTSTQDDYYIGYNHAKGPNSGTSEAANKVVITRKPSGGPDGYGESWKESELSVGQSYTIPNYRDSGSSVKVTFESVANGSSNIRDATISIETISPEPTLSPTPTNCDGLGFTLEVTTDRYGYETSWSLTETQSGTVLASIDAGTYANNENYAYGPSDFSGFCLNPGTQYTFKVNDTYGDGMCCSYGSGGFVGKLEGETVIIGGEFSSEQVVSFTTPGGEEPTVAPIVVSLTPSPIIAPTLSPTNSPTKSPTSSPTRAPTAFPTNSPTAPPTKSPTVSPVAPPTFVCDDREVLFKLELKIDNWGYETSWRVLKVGEITSIAESGQGYARNTFYEEIICLQNNVYYEFVIQDSYGDGLCCSYGNGFYKGYVNGVEEFSGGTFGSLEKKLFTVGTPVEPSDPPTGASSGQPSLEPYDAPSFTPSEALTEKSSENPTETTSVEPSEATTEPTAFPSLSPSNVQSFIPSVSLSSRPSEIQSNVPSVQLSDVPSDMPSNTPSDIPSVVSSGSPSYAPSKIPSNIPSDLPSHVPSEVPSLLSSESPTETLSDLVLVEVLPKPIAAGKDRDAEYIKLFNPSNAETLFLGEYQVYDATSNRYIPLNSVATLAPRSHYTICRNKAWFDASPLLSNGGFICDQEAMFNLFDRISTLILQRMSGEVLGTAVDFYRDIDSVQIVDAVNEADQVYSRQTVDQSDLEPDCVSCWEWKEPQQV